MKIYFLVPIILLSFLCNAFAKEAIVYPHIFISKIDTNSVNNNFENGVSPTTYRYFFPEVSQSGYNMMIFRTEGMDGINYFGNRLKDVNLDGKIDIIQRVKEHLTGNWDLPSTEPRIFIRNQIDRDFNSKLLIDSLLYFGGEDHKYFEDASGEYFYNFSWFDPTLDQEIGIEDWKGFFKKYGFIENIDYAVGNAGPNQLRIEFMPRLYLKKNGKIKDITSTNLIFSDQILGTRARFPWDQSLGVGDFDGDGHNDILMTGIHASTSEFSGLPVLYERQRTAFYFFRNDGSGKLYCEILDFDVDGGFNWQVPEGTNQYATQMDADKSLELLSELWVDTVGDQNSISIRKFGYFDVNTKDKKVEFIPVFNGDDYLLDTKWNIYPKLFLPMGFLDPQRELILYLFTSPSGSPAKEFTGVNTDNTTGSDFTKGVVQQYFRMYEKIKQGNTFKLTDVTREYFFDGEYETLSLDNSGTIHLIDVDNDGKLDIYPQLGATPNKVMGGINQFLNYPSWNGKKNMLYYFKQTEDKKFKLTDLAEIKGRYYPNNLENGYSVFDDNSSHKNGEQNLNLGNFTFLNNASLNDLDGDGNFEIITAGNPDFLNVFTKSKLQLDKFKNLSIAPKLKISLRHNGDVRNTYDFSNLKFSSDTLLKFLDESLNQQFLIIDSLKKMTHSPNFLEAYPKKSTYYISPNLILSDKLRENVGPEVALGEGRWSLLGKEGDLDYNGAYYVRIDDDFEIKSKNFFLSNKNLAPLPFKELSSKVLENPNSKGFEIEMTNSFDINQNFYFANNQKILGLKYGYELFYKDSLIKKELFPNVGYKSYENDSKTKIYGLTILTGNLNLNEVDYKLFALDSFDETIKTYATNIDRKAPELSLQSNINALLDEKGEYVLTVNQVDIGSKDNLGITQMAISKSKFTCADLGVNKITFTANDASGNSSTAEVTVTVIDDTKPVIKSKSSFTVKLDSEGKAVLKLEDLDAGSSDNCSIKDITLSKSTFTCADLGVNKITFTAKDASGNSSSEEVTITVIDSIKPTIKSKATYTINLNAQREGAIKWEDIDEGSSDNCSIKERVFSKAKFTCADIGVNEITYTITDLGGNSTSTLIKVTINPAPEVAISAAGPTTITQTGNVVLSGSTATGFSYQWYKDDVAIASATASNYTARVGGSYKLKIITPNGCEALTNSIVVKTIFVLAATNFQVNLQGETCRTSDNGKITIAAVQNLNYTATLSKSGQAVKTANFNTSTELTGLAAGNYTLCFTVAGQTEYKQCYELIITEPLDLSVYSKVNPVNNTLDLLMSGGDTYYITLNGEKYTSYTSKMSLGLKSGLNKITVNSSQICQGLYTEEIYVDEKIQAYPNPFSSILNLKIENQENKELLVRIVDRYGLSAYEAKHLVVNNLVTLDLSKLDKDYYFVVIGKQTFKVIKQ